MPEFTGLQKTNSEQETCDRQASTPRVSSHKLALGHPLEGPLKIYPVSDLVNSPKTDDARCIEPVPTARKSVVNS